MARYIDLDKLDKFDCDNVMCTKDGCAECFYNNGGAEDVAPIVHSSWRTFCGYSKCNNCGQRSVIQTNYCPNCNAKMDKE